MSGVFWCRVVWCSGLLAVCGVVIGVVWCCLVLFGVVGGGVAVWMCAEPQHSILSASTGEWCVFLLSSVV